MGVDGDYKQLADRLVSCYSQGILQSATKTIKEKQVSPKTEGDRSLMRSIASNVEHLNRYKDAIALDKALDAIDIAKIYEGVDRRELENKNKHQKSEDSLGDQKLSDNDSKLGYEDFVVLETLKYFKQDFFTWLNKPKCPVCQQDGDNIRPTGTGGPPRPNPDEIGVIEQYKCTTCNQKVEFPRINSPLRLLETRCGRCGEWVNCFMLVLQAILGLDAQLRYVWNMEDHVWCEYYSTSLGRWVHLDPCENVFDEPSLYCENWGKKMSYCIGIGDTFVIDLSDKYTKADSRIAKLSVVSSEKLIDSFISRINASLLIRYWNEKIALLALSEKYTRLYEEVIVMHTRETASLRNSVKALPTSAPRGRQTGSAEWTKSRGEDGA